MKVRFWGTRGSIPTPGPDTCKYGGNTLCVTVTNQAGNTLILDAGSGIYNVAQSLAAFKSPDQVNIFLTHTHWDHIQGLPFFFLVPGNSCPVTIYGPREENYPLKGLLDRMLAASGQAYNSGSWNQSYKTRELGEETVSVGGFKVSSLYLNHTVLCIGYRIEADDRVVTYCTDVEPSWVTLLGKYENLKQWAEADYDLEAVLHDEDRRLIKFAKHADLHIQDAMYTAEQYQQKVGWGHSTWQYAASVALAAKVKKFAMYHHDPVHNDGEIDSIVTQASELVRSLGSDLEVVGATEALELEV